MRAAARESSRAPGTCPQFMSAILSWPCNATVGSMKEGWHHTNASNLRLLDRRICHFSVQVQVHSEFKYIIQFYLLIFNIVYTTRFCLFLLLNEMLGYVWICLF